MKHKLVDFISSVKRTDKRRQAVEALNASEQSCVYLFN